MKETLEAYFPELLRHEGGYVDHPADPGGATNMGVTIGALAKYRGGAVTKADVRKLTKGEAREIYRTNYWNAIKADGLPPGVDALAFDIAVNHGVGRWKQWKPLIAGLSPVDAVRAVTERRRRFYRSLKTFPTFGKGWMRRADAVEAWALNWAEARGSNAVSAPPAKTPATSKVVVTSGALATVGTVTTIATQASDAASKVNDATGAISGAVSAVAEFVKSPYFPWIALAVVLSACAFFAYDRIQKMRVHGV